MKNKRTDQTYLSHPKRLADVITAIQVMGNYVWASRKIDGWEKALGRVPVSTKSWSDIFSDHPEFFCKKGEWYSLVWRRSHEKQFDTRSHELIQIEQVPAKGTEERKKFTRPPLEADQVQALIETAIKLQSTAVDFQVNKRWWVYVASALVGVVIGSLLKGCIS